MKQSIQMIIVIVFFFSVVISGAEVSDNDFERKIVKEISFKIERGRELLKNLPVLKTEVGKPLRLKELNYDFHSVYATGSYEDIKILISEGEDSKVEIIFELKPFYFVKEVLFTGAPFFKHDVLEERANLTYLTRFRPDLAERIKRDFLHFYRSEGFYNAVVEWKFNPDEEGLSGELDFTLRSGKPAIITGIEIVEASGIEKDFSFERFSLLNMGRLTGKRKSEAEIAEWVNELREKLKQRGYYTTHISLTGEKYNSADNTVVLQFKLSTDGIIRLSIAHSAITEAEFLSIIGERTGRRLGKELQMEWVSLIKEDFISKGYADAQVYSSRIVQSDIENLFGKKISLLRFLVKKGKKKYIIALNFENNNLFDSAFLVRLLADEEDIANGTIVYTPELIDVYRERLISFYRSRGYLNILITVVKFEESIQGVSNRMRIVFSLEEGIQSRIYEIKITGNPELTEGEISDSIDLALGDSFSSRKLDSAVETLQKLYSEKGFPQALISARAINKGKGETTVIINIEIPEKNIVDMIILNGNLRTKTEYIRRKLGFTEGDSITRSQLLEAQLHLYDLGLFSKVEFSTLPCDVLTGRKRVLLKLQESQPVLVNYGGGIDTENLLRGTFSVTHSNLGGTGQKASLRLALGNRESSAQFTYQVPDFIGENWDLFASVFYEEHRRESFGIIRGGGVVQLSRRTSPQVRYLLSMNVERVELFDVLISELLIPPEEREASINSLSSTLILDYRNDPFNPVDGFFVTSNIKWASSLLGSHERFIKGYFKGNYYSQIFGDVVLAFGMQLGMGIVLEEGQMNRGEMPSEIYGNSGAGLDEYMILPPSERFFAGGSNTLRAFPLDSIGPTDEETGLPVGGSAIFLTNIELRAPLLGNFGFVLFFDVGSVFDHVKDISFDGLSMSIGFGLRYNTPVGPLRVDFGVNPNNSKENQIFISIGHAF